MQIMFWKTNRIIWIVLILIIIAGFGVADANKIKKFE